MRCLGKWLSGLLLGLVVTGMTLWGMGTLYYGLPATPLGSILAIAFGLATLIAFLVLPWQRTQSSTIRSSPTAPRPSCSMLRRLGGQARYNWKILLSGYAPKYAYELGRLDTSMPFADLKRRSQINERAREVGAHRFLAAYPPRSPEAILYARGPIRRFLRRLGPCKTR
jgi:hypothetical protein